MNLEYKITMPVVILATFMLLFPFLAIINFPLFGGYTVFMIEAFQALLLFTFAVFTYSYMQPFQLKSGQKQFWLWAVFWWLLLFGRSTSWGRDYFPDVPRGYFRALSICFIAPVVFMLFSRELRSEITIKFKHARIYVWPFILSVLGLIIADSIERERFISSFIVYNPQYQDFLEELYEFPLIIGLFLFALPIMRQDKQSTKK